MRGRIRFKVERRFAEQQMFYWFLWLIRSCQTYKDRVQSSHPRGEFFMSEIQNGRLDHIGPI